MNKLLLLALALFVASCSATGKQDGRYAAADTADTTAAQEADSASLPQPDPIKADGEDTVRLATPAMPEYVTRGQWWKDAENQLSVKLTANGQIMLKAGKGEEIMCSYTNSEHEGKQMIDMKSDDGTRHAVLEWDMADGEGASALLLTQQKGNILPEDNTMYIFKETR